MGVVIEETSNWEPNPTLFIFFFICSFFSISLFPSSSSSSSSSTNNKSQSPFSISSNSSHVIVPFLRQFLFLFSIASLTQGLWSVFGEYEFLLYAVSNDQTTSYLCLALAVSLLFGPFLGTLSDFIGHKKACSVYWIVQLFVAVWKRVVRHDSIWVWSFCLPLSTSIFSFSFESWLVVENHKRGYGQETLNDAFWLMTFFESASSIGSQVLGNWLLGSNPEKGILSTYTAAIFLAIIGVVCVTKGWKETTPLNDAVLDYRVSYMHIFSDKRIWLLGFSHACLQFSIAVFWILWAPTLVADGREVYLGLVYPCLLGARMLGSTVFPWLLTGPLSLRTEDCLVFVFFVLGLALSIVAYDYQEIGVLVSVFCLFHAGVGLVIPSLARLRTMHVPNELRGGMMSLSVAPANAAILFLLIQRGYYHKMENSTMMAFAAFGLFLAAGCMHLLKRWGKQPYQNWHKL